MSNQARDGDESLVYSPTPSIAELYLDLDLMQLSAEDELARWSALIAGTQEVLSRFDHLAEPRVFCASATSVIDSMTSCVRRFRDLKSQPLAHCWRLKSSMCLPRTNNCT